MDLWFTPSLSCRLPLPVHRRSAILLIYCLYCFYRFYCLYCFYSLYRLYRFYSLYCFYSLYRLYRPIVASPRVIPFITMLLQRLLGFLHVVSGLG